MKQLFLSSLLSLVALQLGVAQGFSLNATTVCFPEEHPVTFADVTYKANVRSVSVSNVYENLTMRIYWPTDLAPGQKRPLVMLIHSGGFVGGSASEFYATAELLAKKGIIAATISYRLCKKSDCTTLFPLFLDWNGSMLTSAYAAACDANDALRYLKANAAQYKINTSQMFVGGFSAGAVTSYSMAFMDQDEAQQVIPNAGTASAAKAWTREPLDPVSGIAGIMAFSGAVFNTNWIDADEKNIPVFLAHGTTDEVVRYSAGSFVDCLADFPTIYGSSTIANRLKQIGSEFYLYTGVRCSHDVFAAGFLDNGLGQAFSFFVKTVLEGQQSMKKHTKYTGCNSYLCVEDAVSTVWALSNPYTIKQGTNCTLNFSDPSGESEDRNDISEEQALAEIASSGPGDAFRIFPNPASAAATLAYRLDAPGSVSIWIFDLTGRLVLEQRSEREAGEQSETLDLAGFAKGLYLVRFQSGESVVTMKLEVAGQ